MVLGGKNWIILEGIEEMENEWIRID